MAEHRTTVERLQLRIARSEPPIWISRLVIYKDTSPPAVIRDQPLHRGLNIIWGVDEIPQGPHLEPVLGHSVGKTSFCRLLRFCLGEDHFADEQTRELIRAEFPRGYVGAEVHVAGKTWAVARPIGRASLSYAMLNSKLEDIWAGRPLPQSFHEYRAALTAAAFGKDSPRPDLPPEKVWGHFLAWCARDQEARYESLWGWRSTRSDSDSPAFAFPKAEAIRFIRTAARILSKKEVKFQKDVQEKTKDIEDLGKAIEERERLPDYWRRHYREELQRLGVDERAHSGQEEDLFDPSVTSDGRQAAIKAEVTSLDQELLELDRKISIAAARVDEATQMQDELEAVTTDTTMDANERTAALNRLETRVKEIRAVANKPCKYAGITIGQCRHAQDNLITLGSNLQKARRTAPGEVAILDQQAASVTERIDRISSITTDLQKEHDALLVQRREVGDKRTARLNDVRSIELAVTELNRWEQYYRKDTPDPDLLSLRDELRDAETTLAQAKRDLVEERSAQEKSLAGVRQIFNGLVQSILSEKYQGRIEIAEDDLKCSVARSTRLAGEALQTLSILLADLTCMLMGAENGAIHPGFLVHDSPREADLGLRVYQNYLQVMCLLHEKLGGADKAPFQYIVTTTTPPPEAVQKTDTLVLKLSVDNLLFGCVLAEPKADGSSLGVGTGLWT